MEGPRAWDGIQRVGYEGEARREGEGRGPPQRGYMGLVGIVLIALGVLLFIIALTVSGPCNDVPGDPVPVCAPLISPVFGLLFLVLGIPLVIQSYRMRR